MKFRDIKYTPMSNEEIQTRMGESIPDKLINTPNSRYGNDSGIVIFDCECGGEWDFNVRDENELPRENIQKAIITGDDVKIGESECPHCGRTWISQLDLEIEEDDNGNITSINLYPTNLDPSYFK